MPIPKSRSDLRNSVCDTFDKLQAELDAAGPRAGGLACVDDWTVKDLLAVRLWWTEQVVAWIDAGRRGRIPVTPAEGYRWKDTPRLNADIVRRSRRQSFRSIRQQLEQGYRRVLRTIDELDDKELLEIGAFEWAGNYPVARWLSINTTRQYTTARTFVRRAIKRK